MFAFLLWFLTFIVFWADVLSVRLDMTNEERKVSLSLIISI